MQRTTGSSVMSANASKPLLKLKHTEDCNWFIHDEGFGFDDRWYRKYMPEPRSDGQSHDHGNGIPGAIHSLGPSGSLTVRPGVDQGTYTIAKANIFSMLSEEAAGLLHEFTKEKI